MLREEFALAEDRRAVQGLEEAAKAELYRHHGKVYEHNHLGRIVDAQGNTSETMRSRLLVGFGAGVVLCAMGAISREAFLVGLGLFPLLVFGLWLLIRWQASRKARAEQFAILEWFKLKGIPFPYENASEIIDQVERADWQGARRRTLVIRELYDRIARTSEGVAFINWELRPAIVLEGRYAWAILGQGREWEPVNAAEVIDSGYVMSQARFEQAFPDLPPLPGQVLNGKHP